MTSCTDGNGGRKKKGRGEGGLFVEDRVKSKYCLKNRNRDLKKKLDRKGEGEMKRFATEGGREEWTGSG